MNYKQQTLLMYRKTKQVFFKAANDMEKFLGTKESLSFSGDNEDINFSSFPQMIDDINESRRPDIFGHTSPETKVKIHNMDLSDDTKSRELVEALKNIDIKHLEMKKCQITDPIP